MSSLSPKPSTPPILGGAPAPPDVSQMTPAQQRELLARLLKEKAGRQSCFPMSIGQQGLWHAYRRDPLATPFNVYLPSRFRSALDVEQLQRALCLVVQRHPSLRTTFSDAGGELRQQVHERLAPEFSVTPLREASREEVVQAVALETLRPFDLELGPLLRFNLFQLADDDWVVLACTHHIVVDFWSLVVLLRDVRQELSASAPATVGHAPSAEAGSYAAFVREQTRFLSSELGQQQREYWRQQASRGSHVLELPVDRFRPAVFSGRAASLPLVYSPELSRAIGTVAGICQSTPFAVVLSAVQVLLSRYAGQSTFFVGSPFSGRRTQQHADTVGFFVNMLPLLASVDEETSFQSLVQKTSQTIIDALEREQLPIAEIVRNAGVSRDPSRSPLFQVSCTFEKSHVREEVGRASFLFEDQHLEWDFAGLRQENFYIPHQTCHYDLEFVFEQGPDRLRGQMLYCRDLFSPASMQYVANNLNELLTGLVHNPGLPLRQVAWSADSSDPLRSRATSAPGEPIATPAAQRGLVSETAHRTVPGMILSCGRRVDLRTAIALESPRGRWTYADLMSQAAALAEQLLALGVTSGSLVPLFAPRGAEAFVGALAIQIAGGAVVPLDATQPALALVAVLEQLQPRAILMDQAHADHALALVPHTSATAVVELATAPPVSLSSANGLSRFESLVSALEPEQAAYMVFTSGSTGAPKGVVVEHAAVANTLAWRMRDVPLAADDRVLMLLSHQFDAGLGIAWTTLTQAARLVWPDRDALATGGLQPASLIRQIIREGITVLPAIPSLQRMIVEHPEFPNCHSLRYLWAGGEELPADLPELVRRFSRARLWNFYGPTEAAIEATASDVTEHPADRRVPIGYPIANTEILILDPAGHPLPPTVPGEIAICGAGLARGYWQAPERTSERFPTRPLVTGKPAAPGMSTERMYLTGDCGRRLHDGCIEFLGRNDQQVKLNGYRIELGEIEAAIESFPAIERSAVIVRDANTPQARMVAYVSLQQRIVAAGDEPAQIIEALQPHLRQHLPAYKLPAAWMVVAEFAMTSSGKVDRRRLPEFVPLPNSPKEQQVAPRTALELALARIWTSRLGSELTPESLPVRRSFFDLGGSSLQAAGVVQQIQAEWSVHFPASLLFDLADIETIAGHLCKHSPAAIAARFGDEVLAQQVELGRHGGRPSVHPLLNSLKPTGRRPPLFLVHPPGGIVNCYREFADCVSEDQPVYAIRSRGLHAAEQLPESIEQMAADYLHAVAAIAGDGPCVLGGWSLGGLVAYEMCQQRLRSGGRVELLVLLDTSIPAGATDMVPAAESSNAGLEYGIALTLDELGELPDEEQLPFLYEHARRLGVLHDEASPEVVQAALGELQGLFHHHVQLCRRYRLQPTQAGICLLRPSDVPFEIHGAVDRGWRHLAETVQVDFVPGHHHSMVQSPHVQHLVAALEQRLNTRPDVDLPI